MRTKASMLICALIMGVLLVLSNSCKKDDASGVPKLTTVEVTGITPTSAISGGNITDDGGETITARGVCWSTSQTPTISDNKTVDGSGAGNFISHITGLEFNTPYYVRAYATNSKGTGYGSAMSFTPQGVIDIEGNVYKIVTIGTQTWMAENLKTTKYNTGTSISYPGFNNDHWANFEVDDYAWQNNQISNKDIYGALYNWFAVNTGKLCPAGWHVPTHEEWTTLTNYLGGAEAAGGKLKETGTKLWKNPNTGATNESGFSALPGGFRWDSGDYSAAREEGCWWTASAFLNNAWARHMDYNSSNVKATRPNRNYGYSVRCVKD